jgi:hypothetical protein
MQIAARSPNGSFLPFGLFFLLFSFIFLLSACATHNYRDEAALIYRGYEGPILSKDQYAEVWWGKSRGVVVTIDGSELYTCEDPYNCSSARTHYLGAHLLPGEHTFEYQVGCHKCVSAMIRMKAYLLPEHLYEFGVEYRYKAYSHYDYAARLVDTTTGMLVAGRSPDVFEWTWLELEQELQSLSRNNATEDQVIELLSEPNDRMSDNTFVYVACKKVKGVIRRWNDAEGTHTRKDPNACGLLFVSFDKSGSFQNYNYIVAPFRDCYFNPLTVWNSESAHDRADTCRSRLRDGSYAKFRIMNDMPSNYP